jgi:hypothetical protein
MNGEGFQRAFTTMKNILDQEIERIELTRSLDSNIVDFTSESDLILLHYFVRSVRWSALDFFSGCVVKAVGCGFEAVGSQYDDDLEPDDEPYTGVQIYCQFEDEPIVLSRRAYETLCLRVLDFAETVAKAADQPILTQPVWSKIIADRECLRARLEAS